MYATFVIVEVFAINDSVLAKKSFLEMLLSESNLITGCTGAVSKPPSFPTFLKLFSLLTLPFPSLIQNGTPLDRLVQGQDDHKVRQGVSGLRGAASGRRAPTGVDLQRAGHVRRHLGGRDAP